MLWMGERRNPSFFIFSSDRNATYAIARFSKQWSAFCLNSFYTALVIFHCFQSVRVVLCQTSYTSGWNLFAFHLKLISFLVSMLFTEWTSSQFMPSLGSLLSIYCMPHRYKCWLKLYGIPLNISIPYDTASHMDASHSLSYSSSCLIC